MFDTINHLVSPVSNYISCFIMGQLKKHLPESWRERWDALPQWQKCLIEAAITSVVWPTSPASTYISCFIMRQLKKHLPESWRERWDALPQWQKCLIEAAITSVIELAIRLFIRLFIYGMGQPH